MMKVRIHIQGAMAILRDAATGRRLPGVVEYTITHKAGGPPMIEITSRAMVESIDGEIEEKPDAQRRG